jgi:ketosteroid isomerase-like protein
MSTGPPPDGEAAWWPLLDIVLRRHKGGRVMVEASKAEGTATKTLTRLNQEYVDAFLRADVAWYRDNLAHDFLCTEPDGSVLRREEFLRDAARGPDVTTYTLKDVRVRIFGNVGLVHATGVFKRPDGSTGTSRYTDVWALMDGRWKTVSAQITRIPSPPKE